MSQSVVHVIFTEDGLPRWFGPEPVKDSEPLDLDELRPLLAGDAGETALAGCWQGLLITHRKLGGTWVLREAVVTVADVSDPVEASEVGSEPDPDPGAVEPVVGQEL